MAAGGEGRFVQVRDGRLEGVIALEMLKKKKSKMYFGGKS